MNSNYSTTINVHTRNSARMFGIDITNYSQHELQDQKRQRTKKTKRRALSRDWLQNHPEINPYYEDITHHTHNQEHQNYIRENYMSWHSDINVNMREILIGWLIEVHPKLKLNNHTLYLAVFIIDKYCHARYIARIRYQLLGLAALFVAAKYQEVKTPKLKNYADMLGNEYTFQQILMMESQILLTLCFNIKAITSCWHLQEYTQFSKLQETSKYLCVYILDLSLIEFDYCLIKPSLLSWSIILYISKLRNNMDLNEQMVVQNSKLNREELRQGMLSIAELFQKRKHSKFNSVNQKHLINLGHLLL